MSEKMKIKISKAEYHALNFVRGLTNDAHYMVILARENDDGHILEGTEETFSDLLHDLYDEVEYELQPKSRLKQIRSVIAKLEPEDDLLESQ